MHTQQEINYNRIAEAIKFIRGNFQQQPGLEELARQVNLSPDHFQRLFTEWAGTSPKNFLQYITTGYAKKLLRNNRQGSLFNAALESGLSGNSRLHDHFIKLEGMTPAEYRNGGENLSINYNFASTPFGKVIIASTKQGICRMTFVDEEQIAYNDLKNSFPKAQFFLREDEQQGNALQIFQLNPSNLPEIKLHLKGTPFQLKVWECLLTIPTAEFSTYRHIAQLTGNVKASRAVGTAVGSNPVAFLIPCHRVLQSTGGIGGYRWGTNRKVAIIGWEGAKTFQEDEIN